MHSSLTRQPSSPFNLYKMQQASSPNIQYKHHHHNNHSPLIQTAVSHFHTNTTNRYNYCHQHHNDSTINSLNSQISHEMASNIMDEVNTTKSIPIKGNGSDDDDDDGDACVEQIVVNSILYKKASSSRMVVDIGAQITQALLMGNHHHYNQSNQLKSTDKMNNSYSNTYQNKERAYMSDLEKLLSCEQENSNVAEWYVMSTTINGSIEHHITGFCANLLNMILKENKYNYTKDKLNENDDETDNSDAESLIQCTSNNNDIDNPMNLNNIISFNYNHCDKAENDIEDSDEDNDDDSFIQFISDDENDCDIQKTFSYDIDKNSPCYNIDIDDVVPENESDDDSDDDINDNDSDGHDDEVITMDYAIELNQDFDNQSNNTKRSVNFTKVDSQSMHINAVDTTDGEVYMPNTSQLHHRLQLQAQMRKPHYNDKRRKKVCFNNHPVVHVMHTWDYAYRAARKGDWEMFARDRARFKLRIERIAEQLKPILQADHRQRIYNNRFVPFYQQQSSEMLLPSNRKDNVEKYSNKQQRRRRRAMATTTPVVSLSTSLAAVAANTAETKTKLALLKCKKSYKHDPRRRRHHIKTPVVLFYCYIF